jgi:hypothetical protein
VLAQAANFQQCLARSTDIGGWREQFNRGHPWRSAFHR